MYFFFLFSLKDILTFQWSSAREDIGKTLYVLIDSFWWEFNKTENSTLPSINFKSYLL